MQGRWKLSAVKKLEIYGERSLKLIVTVIVLATILSPTPDAADEESSTAGEVRSSFDEHHTSSKAWFKAWAAAATLVFIFNQVLPAILPLPAPQSQGRLACKEDHGEKNGSSTRDPLEDPRLSNQPGLVDPELAARIEENTALFGYPLTSVQIVPGIYLQNISFIKMALLKAPSQRLTPTPSPILRKRINFLFFFVSPEFGAGHMEDLYVEKQHYTLSNILEIFQRYCFIIPFLAQKKSFLHLV